MQIRDLVDTGSLVSDTAQILSIAFMTDGQPGAWGTHPEAEAEVRKSLGEGHLSLIALEGEAVIAWVGGIRHYGGYTWELHPLAVHPDWQRRGVGRALVAALEERVAAAGGRNIWLTTDDDIGATTIAGRDIYPEVLEHLASMQDRGSRISFYLDIGYMVTGCIPDAYAPGHHELVFCKRLAV